MIEAGLDLFVIRHTQAGERVNNCRKRIQTVRVIALPLEGVFRGELVDPEFAADEPVVVSSLVDRPWLVGEMREESNDLSPDFRGAVISPDDPELGLRFRK